MTTEGENTQSRYDRQSGVLPTEKLLMTPITIIGVGAIGRQVALQLAAAGAENVTLFDHDIVEVPNLGPQGYRQRDVGKAKVVATKAEMEELNPHGDFRAAEHRFIPNTALADVVFCCVDSIQTRQWVWENYANGIPLFVDGRMSAEVIRVVTSCDPETRDYYPSTLFSQGEAFQGACTARSTIFTANVAAGVMIEQFAKWMRGFPLDRDILFNLLSMELTTQ